MKIQKKLIVLIIAFSFIFFAINSIVVFYMHNFSSNGNNLLVILLISNVSYLAIIAFILISLYFVYGKQFIGILSEISSFKTEAHTVPLLTMQENDDFINLKISFNNLLNRINEDRIKLSRSESTFRTVFEKAPMGIALSNANEFTMLRLNSSFKKILKLDLNSSEKVDWEKITHPDDVEEDKYNMELLTSGKIDSFEMVKRYILNDNSTVWVSMCVARLNGDNPDIPMAICMVNDITRYKEKEKEIMNLTYNDPLTGLKNRNFYEKKIIEYKSNNNSRFSVIVADINGLKMMNDGFGHHYGDVLLRKAAEILKDTLRDTDVICRIGGDEFCIFLPDTSEIEAEDLCNEIHDACKYYSQMREREIFYLSISLGSASKLNPEDDIDDIICEAEDNMQRNKLKHRRKHRLLFLENMTDLLLEKNLDSLQRMNRLSEMSSNLKNIFDLTDEEVYILVLLSNFHNIGKISIPSEIFFKKTSLSYSEIREVRKHPDNGYRITMAINDYVTVADLVLTHHERYDGKGYPQGLDGDSIPKLSRIFSILDSYDAMINPRPYRIAMSKEKALSEIRKNAGTQFDPHFAKIFVDWMSEKQVKQGEISSVSLPTQNFLI